jgi:hypothetical protein
LKLVPYYIMKQRNKFYKNKYLIAIVDTSPYEWIVFLFDNHHQFAEFFDKNLSNAVSILSRLFNKASHRQHIVIENKKYKVEFIEITRKEIEEYGKEEIE